MILFCLEREIIVQENDKTRLDATKTVVTPGSNPIQKVEIRPTLLESFYDVSQDKFLDWIYEHDGVHTITLRITTGVSDTILDAPETRNYEITVITEAEDKLFSNDNDLLAHEDDILKWVRPGRNTFLDKHRAAQNYILSELYKRRITDENGDPITKDHIYDVSEVREWSKFYALYLIFRSISNAVGDVFTEKAMHYLQRAKESEKHAVIRLDLNKDGSISNQEKFDIFTTNLVRR